MTKAYNNFIAVTKQQEKLYRSPYWKMSKAEVKEQGRWVLAGIHQAALFVLSYEEYLKFNEEYNKITQYYWGKQGGTDVADKQLEGQMTVFDFIGGCNGTNKFI